jgi:hypothetical protein
VYYAICKDLTPNRATVCQLHDSEDAARAACAQLGATRLDIIAIRSQRPLALGERIWHGCQAEGVEVLRW